MIIDNIDFKEFSEMCSGEYIRTPLLKLIDEKIYEKNCLIIGSCFANYLIKKELQFKNELLIFNGGIIQDISYQVNSFDFIILQIPLRYIIKDGELWNEDINDISSYQIIFEEAKARLQDYFQQCLEQCGNKPVLVMNFLVPVINPAGRMLNRYDLSNLQFFIEELNKHLYGLISRVPQARFIDIDNIAATFGKDKLSDEFYNHLNHAAPNLVDNTSEFMEIEYNRFDVMPSLRFHFQVDGDNQFGRMIANEIASIVFSIFNTTPIKLIVSDLDNTLWRGIIGEGLNSNGGDKHSAYVKNFYQNFGINSEDLDFYRMAEGFPYGIMEALHYCKKRGIMLGIISKNNEMDGLNGIRKIYSGKVNESNFVGIKINWSAKSENMRELLSITNILPSNVLFIDDNPVERQMMHEVFPDMLIMGKYMFYAKHVLHNSHFTNVDHVTNESIKRTELVKSSVQSRNFISKNNDLKSLKIKALVSEINAREADASFVRSIELINKTNQFNINGLRIEESNLLNMLDDGGHLYSIRVADKFSDHGIVGSIITNKNNVVVTFVISCRVLGLNIENFFINQVCKSLGLQGIYIHTVKTDKNFPAQMWIQNSCENSGAVQYKIRSVDHIDDML
jgi:FkbH-like protein